MTQHNTKSFYKALPDIVAAINKTISTPIGMAPDDVNDSNVISVWKRLWGEHVKRMEQPRPPPKYQPGSLVRISTNKILFSKGMI